LRKEAIWNPIYRNWFKFLILKFVFIFSETEGVTSNFTEISRSEKWDPSSFSSSYDIETGRSPNYHLAGLFYDFILTPLLNAGLTVVTLGTGGFLSVILNLVLAVIRHTAGFLWKALKLYLKVHSFGWGWGFPFSSHVGWGSGWKRDFSGGESFLL